MGKVGHTKNQHLSQEPEFSEKSFFGLQNLPIENEIIILFNNLAQNIDFWIGTFFLIGWAEPKHNIFSILLSYTKSMKH